MPSYFRSNVQSGPVKRSCVSVAAIGSSQSGNSRRTGGAERSGLAISVCAGGSASDDVSSIRLRLPPLSSNGLRMGMLLLGIAIGAIVALLVIAVIAPKFARRMRAEGALLSRAVTRGQIYEQLVPYLPGFR